MAGETRSRELEIWADRKLPEMKDVVMRRTRYANRVSAHVVISLGAEGALWVNASGEWIAKPRLTSIEYRRRRSMVDGLIYGLLMRESSEHTLRLATAVAALAVSQGVMGITVVLSWPVMARVDLQPFN